MNTAHYTLYGEVAKGEVTGVIHHILGHLDERETDDYGTDSKPKHYVLHLNSPGGDLIEALAAINLMRSIEVPITTVANVGVESAALLLFLAGDRRIVLPNSYGMAHHMSADAAGNFHNLKDIVGHLEMLEASMLDIFAETTDLDELFIKRNFLGRSDFFMSAYDMVRYNIATEMVEPKNLQKVLESYDNIKKKA